MTRTLEPCPVASDAFTFSDGVLAIEDSDLRARGLRLGRVYPDACDVGLTVVSRRTGRRVVFALDREIYDREGELLWLELLPVDRSVPARVHIYND